MLYADDTTIVNRAEIFDDLCTENILHHDALRQWFPANRLTLNGDKTKTMVMSLSKFNFGNPHSASFFGVEIQPNLNSEINTGNIPKKLARTIYCIRYHITCAE